MDLGAKVILPGAAGLVGQNLVILLKQQGFTNILAIDKHLDNTAILRQLHPDITVIEADVSVPGPWQGHFKDGDTVVMLQCQIGGDATEQFIRNNITSTELVLETCRTYQVPYVVHVSSSVVESVANDNYSNTKKEQEEMVRGSGLSHCVLRPTLMFGWFDRKHLGWLSRFMRKVPVFPIPGDGRFMRQPLYALDFCRIIVQCIRTKPHNEVYNITGREHVTYVDIIKTIRKTIGARTWIVHIPFFLFWILLKIWGVFDRNPPFTADQLEALVAGDEFEVIPWWEIFDCPATPFATAIQETFLDTKYSKFSLKF